MSPGFWADVRGSHSHISGDTGVGLAPCVPGRRGAARSSAGGDRKEREAPVSGAGWQEEAEREQRLQRERPEC